MMDTTKKYMYMHTDHWRPSIIHSSMNKWMNEWEIKKKDGTDGWNRRTVVTFRWYLGFVYLVPNNFSRTYTWTFTLFDLSWFFLLWQTQPSSYTYIIYISRKIKRLVVGALKKKQNKFYVISSPNSLQSLKDRNLWYKGPTHPLCFCRSYLMKTTVRYVLNNSSSETFSVLLIVGKKEWKMEKKI